jgi:hypothetical protein
VGGTGLGGRGPWGAVQTKPICRRRAGKTFAKARGLDDATRKGTNVRNKPNLRVVPAKIKVLVIRESKKSGGDAQPTKRRRRARSRCAKQTQFTWDRPEEARAAGAVSAAAGGVKRAKRSQFAPEQCGGQVLCGKGVTIDWTRERPRQNEANFRRGRLYKQTQFAAEGPGRPSPRPGP